jgi:hypothetical protein
MQSLVKQVLAAWREAERIASASPRGSASERAARDAVQRLRDLYVDLTAASADEAARRRVEPVMPERPRKVSGRPRR